MANNVKENKLFINAGELSEILGVSIGFSYKLIRELNEELSQKGFLTISGRVSRKYFEHRLYDLNAKELK